MTTYTPTVWQDNDIITAQKLNKIETRIEEIQANQRIFNFDGQYLDEINPGGGEVIA